MISTWAKVVVRHFYLLCAVVALVALLHNHWQTIFFELPLDYNETASLTVTATIVEGGNPYSLESQPSRTSLYPVLINIVVAPLTKLFGNTMQLHRVVSAIFIAATCMLLFAVSFRESRSVRDSFAAAILIYASFLFYSTPISGPNAIGLFFFFASLAIPWLFGFSRTSLFAALVAGLLAFYSKQYFVAGLGYVALYMFLVVSKKRAVVFGFVALLSFVASLALVHKLYPYYLDATLFVMASSQGIIASNEIMLGQMRDYGIIVLPLLLIPLLGLVDRLWSSRSQSDHSLSATPAAGFSGRINLRDLNAPLLDLKFQYVWHCLVCSVFIFAVSLGKNPGNHLTYLFQLVSPFLAIAIAIQLATSKRWTWLFQILLVWGLYNAYAMQSHDLSIDKEANWRKLEALVASADTIYGSNIVLNEILKNNLEIVQNGHTPYFVFAELKPAFFRHANPDQTVTAIWSRYVDTLHERIRTQDFDVIILDQWTTIPDTRHTVEPNVNGVELMKQHYRLSERFPVSAAKRPGGGIFAMKIWVPIEED